MHRTEGVNNVAGYFVDGPPGTALEENWHNAVQEEIIAVLTAAGIDLLTASTDTRDQLNTAIQALIIAAFDADLPTLSLPANVTISAFIKTLLDDADVGAAQTTLGISAFIKTLLDDADVGAAQTTLGISAFIKTLLDDADAATARATLGAIGLGNGDVGQTSLKTSMGSVDRMSAIIGPLTLPGGEYGFYPQVKMNNTDAIAWRAYLLSTADYATTTFAGWTSYVTNISLGSDAGHTIYVQQRYVTASGEVFWIFILRDKTTKNIISMYQAPDHPCMGNSGKPLLISHPFGSYDKSKHEIIVINPIDEEVQEMRAKTVQEDKPDKDLLDVILEEYEIDEISTPKWPTKKVTVGLPPDWDEAWRTGKKVTPIKKVIPQPSYILCRKLKKK